MSVVFDIPCFRCSVQDRMQYRRCVAANCERLTDWLRPCSHESVVKCGFYKYKGRKRQKWGCKNCGKNVYLEARGYLKRYKNPTKAILMAKSLSNQGYSSRRISAKLHKDLNVKVSYSTVAKWLKKDLFQGRSAP